MSRNLNRQTAAVFSPLLHPARYKGAWGGRGSGKSHFFAEQGIIDALNWPGWTGEGLRFAAIREVQKSLKQSAKKLFEDKLVQFGLGEADGFKVFREVIETPNDGIITFTGMQDHTADSVKSMEGFHRAWVEESQSLSQRSLGLLRPTIRWENLERGLASELWFSWNPERPTDAVDQLLRGANAPTDATVVRANWSDNPWFPRVLNEERKEDLAHRPERYGHVWEGEYATVLEGAYYARYLTEAQLQNRIGFFARAPLSPVYAIWDIGSTSGKADATAIWIVQYIGDEVRLLDYYEAVGQDFASHVNWLRSKGYGEGTCVLPHDGVKHDNVFAVTPESFLRQAGFRVETVPNQGRGAAIMRIEAARQMFPQCRFDEENTAGGREALGWYHEKRDEKRNIGLGPEHDFASHAADAFGLVAVYRERAIRGASMNSGGALKRGLKGIA
jgi:phage terminase large subunit